MCAFRLLLVLLLIFCSAGTAWSEAAPDMKWFITNVGAQNEAALMLDASGRTVLWVAAKVEHDGHPILCVPPKLPVTGDQFRAILVRYLDDNPSYYDDRWTECPYHMMNDLIATFPCKAP